MTVLVDRSEPTENDPEGDFCVLSEDNGIGGTNTPDCCVASEVSLF